MSKSLTVIAVSILAIGLAASPYAWAKDMKSTAAEIRASKIIGRVIRDQQGLKLGKIKEILVDPQESGRIIFALVDPVRSLKFGHDRLVAIPFTALSRDGTEHYYVLNMTRNELMKAPSFDEDHWPNFSNRSWDEVVYRFFGQTPYWTEEK